MDQHQWREWCSVIGVSCSNGSSGIGVKENQKASIFSPLVLFGVTRALQHLCHSEYQKTLNSGHIYAYDHILTPSQVDRELFFFLNAFIDPWFILWKANHFLIVSLVLKQRAAGLCFSPCFTQGLIYNWE